MYIRVNLDITCDLSNIRFEFEGHRYIVSGSREPDKMYRCPYVHNHD